MLDCRLCSYCLKTKTKEKNEYAEAQGLYGFDYYCRHPDGAVAKAKSDLDFDTYPMIQCSRYTDYAVTQPDWCPMKRNLFNLKSETMPQEKKKKTYTELCDQYRKIQPLIPWEEFKEGEIYHLPPIHGKRLDFIITRKNDFYLFGRVIEDNGKSIGMCKYFYKSDNERKFLTKHRIKYLDEKAILEKLEKSFYDY